MDIIPGHAYWLERREEAKPKQHIKTNSIRKIRGQAELVLVDSIVSGTDGVGDYIRVSYTLLRKGTSNTVKTYLEGNPTVNFTFREVL